MRILIFNASHATTELAPALKWSLIETCGPCSEISSLNEATEADLVILICPAGLSNRKNLPANFIAYQLEPYMSESFDQTLEVLSKARSIWDYSQENVNILRERHSLSAYHVPLGFTPVFSDYLKVAPGEKREHSWDVTFLGHLSPRRVKIKELCDQVKLNVLFHQALNLRVMLRELCQTKIALNVHSKDGPFLLETVRLSLLLIAGCCVVSEISSDLQVMEQYRAAGVTFVEYDQLIPTAQRLLQDNSRRQELALQSKNWYSTFRNWSEIVPWKSLVYNSLF